MALLDALAADSYDTGSFLSDMTIEFLLYNGNLPQFSAIKFYFQGTTAGYLKPYMQFQYATRPVNPRPWRRHADCVRSEA